MLAYEITGAADADQPPLLIAHGLFGSGRNWGVIAKRLSDTRKIITVDMRNHGESPHSDSHAYADLAADLAEVIAENGGRADVLGHSMGGKAAMMLALNHPEAVTRLIVADIAPVNYTHTQMQYLIAMRDLDLEGVKTRSEADKRLRAVVPELQIRAFLLQSLDISTLSWRLNLPALENQMPLILGFPEVSGAYLGATMFLTGANSDYVRPEHRPHIKELFPRARMVKIPDAGHWLHAERPREFEAAVRAFLTHPDTAPAA